MVYLIFRTAITPECSNIDQATRCAAASDAPRSACTTPFRLPVARKPKGVEDPMASEHIPAIFDPRFQVSRKVLGCVFEALRGDHFQLARMLECPNMPKPSFVLDLFGWFAACLRASTQCSAVVSRAFSHAPVTPRAAKVWCWCCSTALVATCLPCCSAKDICQKRSPSSTLRRQGRISSLGNEFW